MAESGFVRRRDLDFLVHDWLRLDTLLPRLRFAEHSRETVDALFDLSEELAADRFADHYRRTDQEEPQFGADGTVRVLPEVGAAVSAYAEAGLIAASFDAALGGMQLPQLAAMASMAIFKAANISTAGYLMLTAANARLIAAFGGPLLTERFAKPELDGRYLGTMCLSEPQAGSSLADIATRARFETEDAVGRRYRLSGTKMWISAGGHDVTEVIVHLVLAKIPEADGSLPSGTRGISLFVVPTRLDMVTEAVAGLSGANDVAVAGLNHKMGYRGISNCVLNFGEGRSRPAGEPGAVGWLIGEPGNGLAQMFQMMNEARIAVGLGGACLGYRGYLRALDYAATRVQGRKPGAGSAAPPVRLIEHDDVKRMLLAAKSYSEGALALCLYAARLIDERDTAATAPERDQAERLLGLLTPVVKTWSSEWGCAANDIAIQVHGGYGYTRDFEVEQLYRDNRLNPIHEGTTGIQAIDLLGRKLRRDRGEAFGLLAARMETTAAKAVSIPALAPHAAALATARRQVADAVATALAAGSDAEALRHATPFLAGFGHLVVAWLWLDQALAAAPRAGADPFCAGKLHACDYFFGYEVPKIAAFLAPLVTASAVVTETSEENF